MPASGRVHTSTGLEILSGKVIARKDGKVFVQAYNGSGAWIDLSHYVHINPSQTFGYARFVRKQFCKGIAA